MLILEEGSCQIKYMLGFFCNEVKLKCCLYLIAAQQMEEAAEDSSSTEVASTTAATGSVATTQGRAITTVTQSTPAPGPSVPVRSALIC